MAGNAGWVGNTDSWAGGRFGQSPEEGGEKRPAYWCSGAAEAGGKQARTGGREGSEALRYVRAGGRPHAAEGEGGLSAEVVVLGGRVPAEVAKDEHHRNGQETCRFMRCRVRVTACTVMTFTHGVCSFHSAMSGSGIGRTRTWRTFEGAFSLVAWSLVPGVLFLELSQSSRVFYVWWGDVECSFAILLVPLLEAHEKRWNSLGSARVLAPDGSLARGTTTRTRMPFGSWYL